jgi:glycosyltransferase involved in cell wall biosynthesis
MGRVPSISVIVVAYNAAHTIRACLTALENQIDREFELIVVDSSTDDETASIVSNEFPRARLIRSNVRLYPGAARNRGIAEVTADVIAFVDSDCLAAPNWTELLKRAYSEPNVVAVGGAVVPANPESRIGWGAYLCEFSNWAPSGPPRKMVDIPTCNISYRPELLWQFGPFLENGYCSDTAMNWKLADAGHSLVFWPDLVVAHFNLNHLGRFARKQVMHGNAFARMRCQVRNLSVLQRAALVAGCILLPGLLLWRLIRRVVPAGYLSQALLSLPVILIGLVAWSWGEAKGYASFE